MIIMVMIFIFMWFVFLHFAPNAMKEKKNVALYLALIKTQNSKKKKNSGSSPKYVSI